MECLATLDGTRIVCRLGIGHEGAHEADVTGGHVAWNIGESDAEWSVDDDMSEMGVTPEHLANSAIEKAPNFVTRDTKVGARVRKVGTPWYGVLAGFGAKGDSIMVWMDHGGSSFAPIHHHTFEVV